MYETMYGLLERPFQPIPAARSYFPARAMEETRETLERVIQRGEGPAVVIGPAGVGKTMLCRVLGETFRSRMTVVPLEGGAIDHKRELYQALLHEMHVPFRGLSDGELRLAVFDAVSHPETPTDGVLLIVDESHLLRMRLIEELRLLTNLGDHGRPQVRLVLVADGYLEERLAHPRLESLQQRLAARCYLRNIDRDEVGPYLACQVQRAGAVLEQLFDPSAIAAIATATDGNPRLINQLADHALVHKALHSLTPDPLGAGEIKQAWADLQQLPTPWNTDSQPAAETGSVIEFGGLDDEEDSTSDAWSMSVESRDGSAAEEPLGSATGALHGAPMGLQDEEIDDRDDEPVIVELPSRDTATFVPATTMDDDVPGDRPGETRVFQPSPEESRESGAASSYDAPSLLDSLAAEDGHQLAKEETEEEASAPLDAPMEAGSVELESAPALLDDEPPAPYENPFAEEFKESSPVPLVAEGDSVNRDDQVSSQTAGLSQSLEWNATTQVVAAGAGWLPLETLWVTPGTIPELPQDDRDLIELQDTGDIAETPAAIPQPHVVHLLGSPEQLARIRK